VTTPGGSPLPKAARAIVALVALAACAWFALGARQAISLRRAEAIINAQPFTTARRARTAESLLNEAATLNPDRQVSIDRTQILLERRRQVAARRIAGAVTRDEPQNIEAWLWLAHASSTDPKLFIYALQHIHQLEPIIP
jgi:hypothetical protein